MSLRGLTSILGVTLLATASLVAAAPKDAKKDKAAVPAKEPAKGSAAGSASGSATAAAGSGDAAGSAVAPIEDAPPADMNGVDENPDNPHGVGTETKVQAAAPIVKKVGYPMEEALRPITLPANMSEVSIAPRAQVSPGFGTGAMYARYGITPKVQLGLTYLFASFYNQQQIDMGSSSSTKFHSGKTFGIDVTVLLQNWLAVRVGVPVYVSPLAMSLTLGAPMKFSFGDKFALGGLDDLLNIKLDRFAPRFDQDIYNAIGAAGTCDTCNRTAQSNGILRLSAYGIYQQSSQLAIIGRIGFDNSLGGGTGMAGTSSPNSTKAFIRAGLEYTVKSFFDVGASLGFDDLSVLGSFAPAGYLALRI